MTKKIIHTDNAPAPIGAYNQAIMHGDYLFISGQIAINPKENLLILDSIDNETKQVMDNLKAILEAAGMTFENVVKSSIFMTNKNLFEEINAVYASYFDEKTAPARETVEVGHLPKLVNVEISMIAAR